jgi:DNA-binding NtrC family response regulator
MIDFRIPVLVVDDDFEARQALCGMLQRIGFDNIVQDDGTRVLALLGEHAFGLVLSDVLVESHGGLRLLRAVREAPGLARLPFIITTAVADVDWVRAARQDGVDAYLLRPLDLERLRRVVFRTLARARYLVPVGGGSGTQPMRRARTLRTPVQDDHPMMAIRQDAVELRRRYGRLEARPGGEFPPWEIAFLEWWQFMHHRELLVALRTRPHDRR